MVFGGKDDPIAGVAKPTLEQLPNEVVRFDDDNVAFHAHEFLCACQCPTSAAYMRHSILVAVRQYARDRLAG